MPKQHQESHGPAYDVLRSISHRVDFTPGKYLLQLHALPVSVGWESTIRVAARTITASPKQKEICDHLTKAFHEHTLVGEKLVLYYGFAGLPPKEKVRNDAAVRHARAHTRIPTSEFKAAYPLAVHDRAKLKALESSSPTLTTIFDREDSTFFLFSSIRSFNERVQIDPAQFTQADRDHLSDYSELIGIRAIRRQCFDYVVYDPERELVELRIDCPDGMPAAQKYSALQRVIAAFNQLDVFGTGWTPFGSAPFNFHALMQALYRTPKEGSVFQLGFTASTATSSSNNGARLLRRKNVDLRKDEFHVGGAKHVKDISPYSIGVEWTTDVAVCRPKLIVPGSVKMLYAPPITFPELYVRGCLTLEQYRYLTAKIDKYRQ